MGERASEAPLNCIRADTLPERGWKQLQAVLICAGWYNGFSCTLSEKLSTGLQTVMLRLPSKWRDRFDLGLKVILCDRMRRGLSSAPTLRDYLHHIHIWNGPYDIGAQKPGNQSSLSSLESLITHFKNTGTYDADPITVSADGRVMDGVHRLAACITCGIEPRLATDDRSDTSFDFRYFRKFVSPRGVFGRSMLLKMLQRNISAWSGFHVALVLPRAMRTDRGRFALDAIRRYGSLLWVETLSIQPYFLKFLLLNAYLEEPWLEIGRGLRGLDYKLNDVMDHSSSPQLVMIAFFCGAADSQTGEFKEQIRRHYGIEKSSIHISDEHRDSVSLARAYCSSASSAIPFARFNFHSPSLIRIAALSRELLKPQFPAPSNHLLIGQTALELFGGRESRHVDIIGLPEESNDALSSSDDQNYFQYGKSTIDLIDDLDTQCSVFGLSVVSPQVVVRQAASRP